MTFGEEILIGFKDVQTFRNGIYLITGMKPKSKFHRNNRIFGFGIIYLFIINFIYLANVIYMMQFFMCVANAVIGSNSDILLDIFHLCVFYLDFLRIFVISVSF